MVVGMDMVGMGVVVVVVMERGDGDGGEDRCDVMDEMREAVVNVWWEVSRRDGIASRARRRGSDID
jgi:hypothetical protein